MAEVAGNVSGEEILKLKKGMYLPQGKASVENVKILRRGPKLTMLEITLREGRNRQVRRMLARLGHPVRQLTRVRIGRLTLQGLGPGKYRPLKPAEVDALLRLSKPTKTKIKPTREKKFIAQYWYKIFNITHNKEVNVYVIEEKAPEYDQDVTAKVLIKSFRPETGWLRTK